MSTFDTIFGMITAGLAAIAAISLVVAGVLIMNVMLVAVSQRTAEIGLLKAVGARNRQIIALFLTEAACLSLLGASSVSPSAGPASWALELAFPVLDFRATAWAVGGRRRRRHRERTGVRHPAGTSCGRARSRHRAGATLTAMRSQRFPPLHRAIGRRAPDCAARLTALGIGIGVTAVVLLTSIGEGLNRYIVEQFTQFGTHTLVDQSRQGEHVRDLARRAELRRDR